MKANLSYEEALKRASAYLDSLEKKNDNEIHIFYSIINNILNLYKHIDLNNRQELNVVLSLVQTTKRNTTREIKYSNLLLNIGRVKNFIMKESCSESSMNALFNLFGIKVPDVNKPYTLRFQSKYETVDGLHAQSWTAEQHQRELMDYLNIQYAEVFQMVISLNLYDWEVFELLEYFESVNIIYELLS
jgi:hypothetical protein